MRKGTNPFPPPPAGRKQANVNLSPASAKPLPPPNPPPIPIPAPTPPILLPPNPESTNSPEPVKPKKPPRRKRLKLKLRQSIAKDDQRRESQKVRETTVRSFLRAVCGENPEREGLRDTPVRVVAAWKYWCDGYNQDPYEMLKTFEDGAENYNELVVVSGIPIYSHCEHHLTPFFGTATIGYLPDKRIVGLSKLARIAQMYARRLQVQERLTQQIAHAINEVLAPRAVGVIVECRHLCMESRGAECIGAHTRTSCLFGALQTDASLRAEFLALRSSL